MSPYGLPWSGIWEFLNNHTQGCDDSEGDCRTLNPCWGWLNPDPEVRKNTTIWAESLNTATKKLLAEHGSSFKNFKLRVMPHVDLSVQDAYVKEYGFKDVTNLYSQFGGGHPSQAASILWGEYFYRQVEQMFGEEVLGPVNPRNSEIEAKFPWSRGG
jgi:acyloxyacyl hydrolase